MLEALEQYGNPSSVHASGRRARAIVETARSQLGAFMGMAASQIVFTSGATEANTQAVISAVKAGARRLVIGATEHDSVLSAARASGAKVEIAPVDPLGRMDLDWLATRLKAWEPADGRPFVALMAANNETGVLQPVEEVSELVRGHDGWLHVDAVQAAGRIPLEPIAAVSDTITLSGHKFGAPQGAGVIACGSRASLAALFHGGGQERGLRAGTENVAAIAGLGAAAMAAAHEMDAAASQAVWRDRAQARLEAAGAVTVAAGAERLAGVLCIAAPGAPSAHQVMALDLEGIRVSAGSACSSGKVRESHVLKAMGLEDLAGCAIRASGGWASTEDDWSRFAEAWIRMSERYAARRRAPAA